MSKKIIISIFSLLMIVIILLAVLIVSVNKETSVEEELNSNLNSSKIIENTEDNSSKIDENSIENWATYISYNKNFTFKYPRDWQYYEYQNSANNRQVVFSDKDGKYSINIYLPLLETGYENSNILIDKKIDTNISDRKLRYMLLESQTEEPFTSITINWGGDKQEKDFKTQSEYQHYWEYNTFTINMLGIKKSVKDAKEEIDTMDQILKTFKFLK